MTSGRWQEFNLRWSAGAAAARVPSAWRHRRRGLPLLVLLPWLAAAVRVSPAHSVVLPDAEVPLLRDALRRHGCRATIAVDRKWRSIARPPALRRGGVAGKST